MSFELRGIDVTFPAAEDLSADQYRIMILTSTGTVRRPDAATDIPIGILQNAPSAAGQAAVVRLIHGGGISKVVLGATVATGATVQCEYVGATDAGKAIANVATGYCVGQLVQGADEDELASVALGSQLPKA